MANQISWADFMKVEMSVGTIIKAIPFAKAKKPSYILTIDFGDFGLRKSSAQITSLYTPDELIGQQIIAVLNFPPKQIANIMSECLVLGAVDGDAITLLSPNMPVPNGLRIG